MNRSYIVRAALATYIVLIALVAPCHADSSVPPLTKETIRSMNGRFFAVMEPDKQITTIYRTTRSKQGEKVWSMYGWFRVAALADDGDWRAVPALRESGGLNDRRVGT